MKHGVMVGGLLAAALFAGCAAETSPGGVEMKAFKPGETVRVASLDELQRAVDTATPGEEIVLAKGAYDSTGPVKINCAGKAGEPVLIRAEDIGAVEVKGKAGFTFGEKASWVVVEGFKFTHSSATMYLPPGTQHLRITRNEFAPLNDAPRHTMASTIEVSGDDCEVDHNYFHDKATEGCWVTVQGPGHDQMAQRTWIHHNEFKTFMPSENNCSAIQVGLSWRSMSSGFSLVEYNLFIQCRGENEGMVCNKSCDNVYRYNTITDGTRELSLRHGNRCLVYGNYFLNTDGIRFFGHDHKIFSNYFEGCRPAIHVGNGDATIPPGKLQMHDEPVGEVVAFNTLVNNRADIVMDSRDRPYGAQHVTIADNIIVGGPKAADIQGPLKDSRWEGNVVWDTQPGNIPTTGCTKIDPMLTKDANGIMHLQPGSPAIGKGVGDVSFVMVDIDGQPRRARKDTGADQMSDAPAINKPLTEKDVGPAAK